MRPVTATSIRPRLRKQAQPPPPPALPPSGLALVGVVVAGVVLGVVAAVVLVRARSSRDELKPEERQLAVLTNAARIRERIPDLKTDPALCRVARQHAQAMARTKTLCLPEEDWLRTQVARAGYRCEAWNVTVDVVEILNLAAVSEQLLARDSIQLEVLNREYTDLGVGIVTDDEGFHYLVQLFARRKK